MVQDKVSVLHVPLADFPRTDRGFAMALYVSALDSVSSAFFVNSTVISTSVLFPNVGWLGAEWIDKQEGYSRHLTNRPIRTSL